MNWKRMNLFRKISVLQIARVAIKYKECPKCGYSIQSVTSVGKIED